MSKKINDLAVKTGTYEKDGQTKNRYLNVGAEMENDDGGRFLLIDKSVNFAGIPGHADRQSVLVSKFPVNGNKEPSAPAKNTNSDMPDW